MKINLSCLGPVRHLPTLFWCFPSPTYSLWMVAMSCMQHSPIGAAIRPMVLWPSLNLPIKHQKRDKEDFLHFLSIQIFEVNEINFVLSRFRQNSFFGLSQVSKQRPPDLLDGMRWRLNPLCYSNIHYEPKKVIL